MEGEIKGEIITFNSTTLELRGYGGSAVFDNSNGLKLEKGKNIPLEVLESWSKFAKEYFGIRRDKKWTQKEIDKLRLRLKEVKEDEKQKP